MPFAILRTAKLKTPGSIGGSLAHTFRTRETPNADPSKRLLNEHHGPDTPEAVKAAIEARLPAKRRSDAVLAIEYFVGMSPEAFQGGQDRAGTAAYFRDALDWLKARHGPENVISAHVHRDETTPHLVAYVVPRDGDKLNAKKWLGGKATLSAMQTDFAERVGRQHGLERGLEGSRATHKTVREFYAELQGVAAGRAPEAAQAVSEAVAAVVKDIPPTDLKPQVLEKRMFGLARMEETPDQVAERLAKTLRPAVTPQVEKLVRQVDQLQAEKRAWQRERKSMAAENKTYRERFGELVKLAKELAPHQLTEFIGRVRDQVAANKRAKAATIKAQIDRERGPQGRGGGGLAR